MAGRIAGFDDGHLSIARCEIDAPVCGDRRSEILSVRIQAFLLKQDLASLLLVARQPAPVLHHINPSLIEQGRCDGRDTFLVFPRYMGLRQVAFVIFSGCAHRKNSVLAPADEIAQCVPFPRGDMSVLVAIRRDKTTMLAQITGSFIAGDFAVPVLVTLCQEFRRGRDS